MIVIEDTEAVTAVTAEEMMTENDLVCIQEVEVQKVIETAIDTAMVVEIDQEIVWVEEIDINSNLCLFFSPIIPFFLYSSFY